jgi:hypothetical protein
LPGFLFFEHRLLRRSIHLSVHCSATHPGRFYFYLSLVRPSEEGMNPIDCTAELLQYKSALRQAQGKLQQQIIAVLQSGT